VFELISNSSFIIFPSECYETMGGVIIESFSFSKPVLASNLGAMRELVSDGVNGILFNPGDPEDLAKKVRYLFSHNKERLGMGENAGKYYRERFSREENYRKLMDIYTTTIGSSLKNQ
ncbi:MAG: glycosyltransferase, partial [Candidatus Omnitrophica bacterium]|nr:glycosyltransferase [Candidatus Omnitrophota bacterium]